MKYMILINGCYVIHNGNTYSLTSIRTNAKAYEYSEALEIKLKYAISGKIVKA